MTSLNPTNPVNVPVAKTTFDVKAVAIEIARLLSDDKCSDITLLDVRGISSVQDFVILASGTSDRQMRSAATDVKNLLPTLGSSVYRTSIDDQSTWIVVDCVDTVIHIFEPNTRSYYDLESMWGDAPKVEWLRPGQKPYVADDMTNESPDGDTDEPSSRESVEASEPDADLELTTATAASFVEDVRTSVRKPAASKAKKAAPAAKTKPVAKAKPAAKKPAAKAKAPAAKKAPAKKAAAPAKKAAAKAVKKAPAKKAAKPAKVAKPVKKAAPAKAVKKAPARKAAKKSAKR